MAKSTKSCCLRKESLDQDSGFKVLHSDNDTDMTRHHFFSHLLEYDYDSEFGLHARRPPPPPGNPLMVSEEAINT